jgi:Zn-dependent M16 (insulinase) family peptidase
MTIRYGFRLEREDTIAENETKARLWRHEKTGARLLSLENADENKVFGISFRTPPADSTGVAHILEHSVLCGSRKYPVKEPFVELLKGSLQTFLNAFTYPDKTCYPVASANVKDFYNLIDVYLDAVFFPRITPEIFMQEGWHHERPAPEGPLTFKGVVFNEMKGAYSSPDSLLAEYSQQSLFPDTTYGLDSGGDPKRIPDLTYEAFVEFHRRYYHPGNAWIVFYGDDDPDKRLELLAAYLDQFEPLRVSSAVALQPRHSAPRTFTKSYAAGEAAKAKAYVTVNWLLPETTAATANFALRILELVLIGLPSSPLRKALVDSGLGEDLCGTGLETELRQIYFSTGLKGLAPEAVGKVEGLILETLERIARAGVDADMVEAALNSIEFALRENNTGRFPRGLSLMLRSLTTWLHGADPLALLRFEAPLAEIKDRLARGEKLFEGLIREHLLDNPHRTTLILAPDPALAGVREAEEKERLAAALAAMGDGERAKVAEAAARLEALQAAPDALEDLARIPRLGVADLPRRNTPIPKAEGSAADCLLLSHELATNGIVYLDLAFDLAGLPRELLPWVPLFGRALFETGTEREDFVTLNRRISAKTGGISASPYTAPVLGSAAPAARLMVRAKATAAKAPDMAAILQDVLTGARLTDRERVSQLVLEEKARLEQRLVPSGHMLVASRLRARFGAADLASELMGGVEQLFFLRSLAERLESDWPGVRRTLEELRGRILRKDGLVANLTADAAGLAGFDPELTELLAVLSSAPLAEHVWHPFELPRAEGLSIPAQVNYVGKAVSLAAAGYVPTGADLVVSRYLRTAYLWDRVRVRGGAYGAFSLFDLVGGTLSFVSYRDPNLAATLAVFDETAGYLLALDLGADELAKAIVGAVGDIDTYLLPDAKGYTSLVRHLQNRTEDELQARREEVLATTRADFTRFAEAAAALAGKGEVVVLGSAKALAEAQAADPDMRLTSVL